MTARIAKDGTLLLPDEVWREMNLSVGQTLQVEKISPTELRVTVVQEVPRESELGSENQPAPDAMAALGYAQRHGLPVKTTEEWMKIIRGDEAD